MVVSWAARALSVMNEDPGGQGGQEKQIEHTQGSRVLRHKRAYQLSHNSGAAGAARSVAAERAAKVRGWQRRA